MEVSMESEDRADLSECVLILGLPRQASAKEVGQCVFSVAGVTVRRVAPVKVPTGDGTPLQGWLVQLKSSDDQQRCLQHQGTFRIPDGKGELIEITLYPALASLPSSQSEEWITIEENPTTDKGSATSTPTSPLHTSCARETSRTIPSAPPCTNNFFSLQMSDGAPYPQTPAATSQGLEAQGSEPVANTQQHVQVYTNPYSEGSPRSDLPGAPQYFPGHVYFPGGQGSPQAFSSQPQPPYPQSYPSPLVYPPVPQAAMQGPCPPNLLRYPQHYPGAYVPQQFARAPGGNNQSQGIRPPPGFTVQHASPRRGLYPSIHPQQNLYHQQQGFPPDQNHETAGPGGHPLTPRPIPRPRKSLQKAVSQHSSQTCSPQSEHSPGQQYEAVAADPPVQQAQTSRSDQHRLTSNAHRKQVEAEMCQLATSDTRTDSRESRSQIPEKKLLPTSQADPGGSSGSVPVGDQPNIMQAWQQHQQQQHQQQMQQHQKMQHQQQMQQHQPMQQYMLQQRQMQQHYDMRQQQQMQLRQQQMQQQQQLRMQSPPRMAQTTGSAQTSLNRQHTQHVDVKTPAGTKQTRNTPVSKQQLPTTTTTAPPPPKTTTNRSHTQPRPSEALYHIDATSGNAASGRKDTGGQDSNQEDEEMREQVAVEGGSSRTVEVLAGPGKMKSEEMYQYYFENPRHGGGDIEKLVLDENRRTIIITFEDADVARRIVEREHKIGGKLLTVRLHVPADARPTYPDKLLFQDVPGSTDKEHLETYLELVAGCTPIEILYGDESGTVLVTFDGEPDYQEVQENLRKKKKLQGRQLVVSRVPVSNCLLVENIGPSTSLETVVLYFENTRRSQGGPLERWEVLDGGEDQRCLLHFKDYKVVERILEKTHSIDERELHVRRYLECLGSSGGIVDPTVFDVPKPITLKDVDKFKLAFIRHSRNARDNFFQTLSKIHAKTKFVDNTVILECTLGPNVPQARVLVRTWRKDVQKKVLECLALIKVERVDVIDQIWPEVEKAVDDSDVQSSEDASVSPLQEEKTFVIVGRKEAVEVLKQKIKDRMEVVEKEVERKKQEVTNTVTTLKHYQLRLLEVISFQKQVTEQRKNLTVEINPQGITFHGLLPDVREAQVQMFNELNSAKLHRISKMSSPKKKLLGYKETQHYIQTMFKTEGVIAVWDICEQGEVIVYGFDEDSLSKAAHFLHMSVFDHVLELSAESSKLLQSTDWQLLGKTLLEKHQGTLLIHPSHDGKELILVGTADIMEAVTEMVENFFETNTLYRVVVSFSPSRQRFLAMYWRDRLEKIAQNLTKYKVQTSLAASDSEVLVEGTKQGVRLAIQELEELEKRIVCHEEKLTKRHELMFLTDEQSGKDLNMLEKSNRCVVSRTPEAPGLETSVDTMPTAVAPTETSDTSGVTPMEVDLQTENLPRHSDMQGKSLPTADAVGTGSNLPSAAITPIKVIIIEGEIAKEKADVIVNTTSNNLDLTNGAVSASILAVGGPSLQQECRVKYPQGIQTGDIARTKGYNLDCHEVFHLTLCQWSSGVEKSLEQVITRCLTEASNSQHTSIAFPALGTGNLNYPRDVVARTLFNAVNQFQQTNPQTPLREVKIVVYHRDKATAQAFRQVQSQSGVTPSTNTPARTYAAAVAGAPAPSPTTIKVNIIEGEIAQQKVNVIVNTTSGDLVLTNGAVSASILAVGGPSLQQECGAKYPRGIQSGDIARTKGHNLACQEVFHLTLCSWTHGGQKSLEQLIMKCLTEASKSNYTSIAFPALGTGNLQYPRDAVAHALFDAVRQFQQATPNTSLREVRVVVYHMDKQTAQVFRQVQAQHGLGGTPQAFPARGLINTTTTPSHGQTAAANRIKVSVVVGEIAKENIDVIVNTTSQTLDLTNGAVSASILRAAGPSLQQECQAKYPQGIQTGDIARTKGHNLACKEVFHLTLWQWSHGIEKNLEQVITKCLSEASKSHHTSVAFPALGTGNLNYPRDVVARVLFRAVDQFQQTHPLTTLREVKVVVYHKDQQSSQVFQQVKNQFSVSFAPSGQAQSASTGHRHQRTFTDSTEGKSKDSRGSLPEAEFEIKGLRLVVVHGDIADEVVEVVVNVTNSQLDLTQDYVARSLRVRCGKALEQALNDRAADIQKKGIAVTEAFNLTSRLILHIAVDKFANDWEGAIKLCLKEAEVYKVKSIAMPALGTGHGLTDSDFAKVLLRAINKHFGREKRALLQIRVVMCDRVQVPPFTAAIKALCDNPEQNNVIKGFKALKNMAKGIPNLPVVEVPKPVTASPRRPLSLTEAHFYIYAESNLSVEAFLKAFRDLVSEKFTREEIQDNLLQRIDSALAERLQQTANVHDVEMELQAIFGRMVLDGLKTNVFNAHKDIIQLLRAAERQNQEARAASVVANIVQWYFMEVTNTGFERKTYPPKENHLIETAFQNKDKTVEIMDADKNVFVVDFDLMQEYPKGDKNDPVNVIRREKLQDSDTSLNQLPDTWAPNQKEPVLVIPVTSGSPEYREVEANFRKTLGSVKATVISVHRIQNPPLYRQYAAKKLAMEKQNQKLQNEKTLWHGTDSAAIASINLYGFNRSYCGKNATAYGQGVYFAVSSSYSANATYSSPDSSGKRYMYQCKVLVGHATRGNGKMRFLPPRSGSVLFDSATDNPSKPSMYIVFHDTQAYPEYLITFK